MSTCHLKLFQNCLIFILFTNELIYKMILFFLRCNYIVLYGLKDDSLKLLTWISRLSLEWLMGTIWKSDTCSRASMMSKNSVLLDWIDEKCQELWVWSGSGSLWVVLLARTLVITCTSIQSMYDASGLQQEILRHSRVGYLEKHGWFGGTKIYEIVHLRLISVNLVFWTLCWSRNRTVLKIVNLKCRSPQ